MNAGVLAGPVPALADVPRWLSVSAAHYFDDSTVIELRHLPSLYQSLLVPEDSMTERLEHHFGGPMRIRVLCMSVTRDRYARWVLMFDPARRCVAMAGVCLAINEFSGGLRAAVLCGEQPLGRLLTRHGLPYASVPKAFLLFTPTALTRNLLQMAKRRRIFGRCTDLLVDGHKRGDIVEALPRYDVQTPAG